jgi:MFS family permease
MGTSLSQWAVGGTCYASSQMTTVTATSGSPVSSGGKQAVAGAMLALVLLTLLNLVNYTDRYIVNGVQEMVKHEFHVSDSAIGSITFWFFLTYMLSAPLTGWLGDHFPRKPLIVIAALMISAVNLLTGTVHAFDALLFRHAILGIGEASFGIYAPVLLSDFFPEEKRNQVLTWFYTAIPVGAAIGYLLGGVVGSRYGWRAPFYVSAVPGMLIAFAILFLMKEPARGESDRVAGAPVVAKAKSGGGASFRMIGQLAMNPRYMFATLGMAMVVFSLGGISAWMPSFLERSGMSPTSIGLIFGAIVAGGGLGGTAVGGIVAQRWLKTNHRALWLVSAWSAALTVPFALVSFFGPHATMLPSIAVAMFFIMAGTGPLNAAIINAVPAEIRASALAIEMLLIHALGDTPSPKIIGIISDHSTLGIGLGATLVTMVIAAVLLFVGSRYERAAVV